MFAPHRAVPATRSRHARSSPAEEVAAAGTTPSAAEMRVAVVAAPPRRTPAEPEPEITAATVVGRLDALPVAMARSAKAATVAQAVARKAAAAGAEGSTAAAAEAEATSVRAVAVVRAPLPAIRTR